MAGEYPESIRSHLMIWQDTLGQGWVVVSGDDLPKYLYDNDAITDHVLFKRMKDSRLGGGQPFHPSDAELRISTDPPSHWWGNDLDRYDSDVLPDSLVVDCGGYPTDDGSEGAVFLYSNPLGRVVPDQQVTINWTEADAWVEASGGQIDLSQTFAVGPAGGDGGRSLLVLEYRTGDWSDDPWEIAIFRDLETGRSTSEDAELILQSETYFSGGVGKNIKIVGDLDGDGLSDLVAGEPWTTTPSGSGQFYVVLGGSTGIASLDDVGMLYQPEYGGHAADIIIGELDIDGDGLDDIGVTSPYTGYADGESNLTWCGMINLYSGSDLAVGEGEPRARVSGHRAAEELGQLALERCGSSYICISGGAQEYCDLTNNGIVYVVPTDLEGTHWVDEVAEVAFTGDKPGRNVVPGIAYDEPRGLLALGATTTPDDYKGLGMVYLVDLDL